MYVVCPGEICKFQHGCNVSGSKKSVSAWMKCVVVHNPCFSHRCLPGDMEWFEVSGTGKLITYSKLEYAPIGFQDDVPYSIALLDYGDYKVFGRIDRDLAEDEIKVGMAMKTVSNTLPNGQLNYVFQKV